VDDLHYGPKSKAVKLLAAEFMVKEEKNDKPKDAQVLVNNFWADDFLPYCE
jgi:hypothetical protein